MFNKFENKNFTLKIQLSTEGHIEITTGSRKFALYLNAICEKLESIGLPVYISTLGARMQSEISHVDADSLIESPLIILPSKGKDSYGVYWSGKNGDAELAIACPKGEVDNIKILLGLSKTQCLNLFPGQSAIYFKDVSKKNIVKEDYNELGLLTITATEVPVKIDHSEFPTKNF